MAHECDPLDRDRRRARGVRGFCGHLPFDRRGSSSAGAVRAAGKRAIVAGDWNRAIAALTSAALRDPRNADIQNYLGYVHRRLHQIGRAMRYYERALALNPRHRSAHEHLGEAYLVQGDLAEAREHLARLEQICLIPCEEYDDLKQAITESGKLSKR